MSNLNFTHIALSLAEEALEDNDKVIDIFSPEHKLRAVRRAVTKKIPVKRGTLPAVNVHNATPLIY